MTCDSCCCHSLFPVIVTSFLFDIFSCFGCRSPFWFPLSSDFDASLYWIPCDDDASQMHVRPKEWSKRRTHRLVEYVSQNPLFRSLRIRQDLMERRLKTESRVDVFCCFSWKSSSLQEISSAIIEERIARRIVEKTMMTTTTMPANKSIHILRYHDRVDLTRISYCVSSTTTKKGREFQLEDQVSLGCECPHADKKGGSRSLIISQPEISSCLESRRASSSCFWSWHVKDEDDDVYFAFRCLISIFLVVVGTSNFIFFAVFACTLLWRVFLHEKLAMTKGHQVLREDERRWKGTQGNPRQLCPVNPRK